ncbi:hypothetical protein L596_022250 [Steinernema carpocapsae]|uniref:C2H2-type domain-containing protein n=1 Tax=Steinernema carpocapsae TaxID=34508 RepID=A0A4U5ML70_STECR|nr:hypothetical protein L596_022250 [Steinernema carpocapsae]
MDPESLRRPLVGSLASRDIRIDPVMVPVPKLPPMKLDAPDMPEEPLKPLPIHVQQANLPRPGVVGGRKCSVCSVFFYGNLVLERHMKVVHPREFDDWAAKHCKGYQTAKNAVEARVQEAGASQDLQEAAQESEEEEIESPPMLEAQQAVTLLFIGDLRSRAESVLRSSWLQRLRGRFLRGSATRLPSDARNGPDVPVPNDADGLILPERGSRRHLHPSRNAASLPNGRLHPTKARNVPAGAGRFDVRPHGTRWPPGAAGTARIRAVPGGTDADARRAWEPP